jgi:hypothetical protein
MASWLYNYIWENIITANKELSTHVILRHIGEVQLSVLPLLLNLDTICIYYIYMRKASP